MRSEEQLQAYLEQQPDLAKFGNNYEQACLFYYGILKQLDLRIITTEIQIQNIALTSQKPRKQLTQKNSSTVRQKQESQKSQPQLQFQPNPNQFECRVKGCSKIFDKKSALDIHDILRHKTSPSQWMNNKIFNIEIREIGEGGRRGSRGHY